MSANRCNQSCFHCHVNAGPTRTEEMTGDVATWCWSFWRGRRVVDARHHRRRTGAECDFRRLVIGAAHLGLQGDGSLPISPILEHAGQEDLREFLSAHQVEVVASIAVLSRRQCRTPARQRRCSTPRSRAEETHALGYGRDPKPRAQPPFIIRKDRRCRPGQASLEADYKRVLGEKYGIRLPITVVLANIRSNASVPRWSPKCEFEGYIDLLQPPHLDANLDGVMCRT